MKWNLAANTMRMTGRIFGLAALVAATGCGGEAGEAGTPGEDGLAGVDGADGVNGVNGEDGVGAPGEPGAPGAPGADGADGADGVGEVGPAGPAGPVRPAVLLDARIPGWLPANVERLNELLEQHGSASPGYDATLRPVAIFDWDNTVIKNDIGDATMIWMIRNAKILQPAGYDWLSTNPNLSAAAVAALNTACDAIALPEQPLPTDSNTACADELFHAYYNGRVAPGVAPAADAWLPGPAANAVVTLTINQPYAWLAQLQAGYTPDEIRDFARAAWQENSSAPLGATQTVGTASVTGYTRIYEPIRDLIGALDANGFEVWIVTASPQYVVDAVAEELVGVPAWRVIGIRTTVVGGVTTSLFQGCGGVPDGNTSMITFDEGKRCWINKVIFREPEATQLAPNLDPARRAVFVAGDSDTDIAMIKDASVLKLAINRNKTQLMCNAYSNLDGRWLVQPMFLSPKGPKAGGYSCDTALDAAGAPIVDEAGDPMAHQEDTVSALP